ncbi:MAG: hypothetical protein D6798_13160 [Deltaproteobacteria bacterium]|nr:MAG: hypothetical protein D6798_13160 [Deltaproteobacteria bacterium]
MGRLVLIMGVQRSGTNALFKSLTSAPGVLGVNESPDSAFFENVLLRPEPALRPHLRAHDGPIVLKPISETNRRGVDEVIDELLAHDPVVPWIYRDPVNCFHSHVQRWKGFRGRPQQFAEHWSRRNRLALDALDRHGDRIAIVRYEDLVADPSVFHALADFVGVPGSYLFRADRGLGRNHQPAEVQACIDAGTAATVARLDAARRFVARPAPPWVRIRSRVVGRLSRELHKLGGDP